MATKRYRDRLTREECVSVKQYHEVDKREREADKDNNKDRTSK